MTAKNHDDKCAHELNRIFTKLSVKDRYKIMELAFSLDEEN